MSQPLISHSPDLQQLRDEGYDIRTHKGYLLVAVPYVDGNRRVREGTLVTNLDLASGHVTATPNTHVVSFIGDHPCDKHGKEIEAIRHSAVQQQLAEGLVVDRQFSNKPPSGYRDYYHKVSNYAAIIGHEAESLDPSAKIRTYRVRPSEDDNSPFAYPDTASTKAGVAATTDKLSGQKVAIVGLGGTGSYTLDLLAKCPVAEIHLFDGDFFHQHNAFRSPGAPVETDLDGRTKKVEWFASIYLKMHLGIRAHPYFLSEDNREELKQLDFVFLCIDRNDARKELVDYLVRESVPFVDAGMGIELDGNGELGGILRVTTVSPAKHDHVRTRIPMSPDGDGGLYASNIQVADLNCLNATMAVIRWKKAMGFYRDFEQEHHTTYTIDTNLLHGEESVQISEEVECAELN